MSKTTLHFCLDIRGFLKNAVFPREYRDFIRDDEGHYVSPERARELLFDELAQGRKVLPLGEPCEGFSYETGCPGHPEPAIAEAEGRDV